MTEYYSVTQYAEVFGKDPGNIRRMLINGSLQGEKIGNQWIIPKSTIYPQDRRIKSGEYRNWRQRTRINSKHPKLLKKLYEMCEEIANINTGSITEIILYGSYARGQEKDESDIDIAIVLRANLPEDQYDKITDIVVDYELDIGKTVSTISFDQSEFIEWKAALPFYKNIDKEGIILWKSA